MVRERGISLRGGTLKGGKYIKDRNYMLSGPTSLIREGILKGCSISIMVKA